jgi:hypothetical protein
MRNLMNLFAIEMAIYSELMNNPLVANLYATEVETPPTRETIIVDWLKSMGLKETTDTTEQTETTITLTLSELETIKREMDILKVRAEEGEELARKLDALHSEFFPSQE